MSSTNGSLTPPLDKGVSEHIEHVSTREQVPGHSNYYEKDGLRTYGDGESECARCPQRVQVADMFLKTTMLSRK